jgi:hypothetical protein
MDVKAELERLKSTRAFVTFTDATTNNNIERAEVRAIGPTYVTFNLEHAGLRPLLIPIAAVVNLKECMVT